MPSTIEAASTCEDTMRPSNPQSNPQTSPNIQRFLESERPETPFLVVDLELVRAKYLELRDCWASRVHRPVGVQTESARVFGI